MPSASQAASAGIAVGAVAVVVTFGAWTAANVRLVPAPAPSVSQQSEPVLDDSYRATLLDAGQTASTPAATSTSRTKPESVRSSVDAGSEVGGGSPSSSTSASTGVGSSDAVSGSDSTGTGTGSGTATGTGTAVQVVVPPPALPTVVPDPCDVAAGTPLPDSCPTPGPDSTDTPETAPTGG